MSTVLNATAWAAFLKELYPDGLPEMMLMRRHVFMTMVSKSTDATGDHMVIPVEVDGPGGRSADIAGLLGTATGQGYVYPTTSRKFNVYIASDYAGTFIDELTILKAGSDKGAFVSARQHEVDNLLRKLGDSLAHALYRTGDGSIGRGDGAWTITGAVITLLNRADTKFFGIGQPLDFVPNSAGQPGNGTNTAARTVTNRAIVTKISEDAGTVTCALDITGAAVTNLSSVYASLANTDWICVAGDYNPAWATTANKVRGLAGWIPLVEPVGGDNFWLVDRSTYPTRLAGHRLNDPTAPAEDSIMSLGEIMRERGASPDAVFISPRQFTKMSKRLNAKVEYTNAGGEAKYGFASFMIATSAGLLPVYCDSDCPEDRGYILSMDTWSLRHLQGLPHLVTTDGLSALRRNAADQIEVRARYYAQLVCLAPGQNGVFAVS